MHRLAAGERRAGDRRDAAGCRPVPVARRRRARALGVVDRVRPVVHRPAAIGTPAPPRHVGLAPAERHPAEHRRAERRRERPPAAAVPRHHRRRPDRARDEAARGPAPAPADVAPPAVVERRVTPRCVVDPGPAPAADPRPAAEPIRCPTHGDRRREPHRAVLGNGLPFAELVEVGVAHHLPRHVARAAAALVVAIAVGAPRVETVDPVAGAHVGGDRLRSNDGGGLPGQHLLRARRELDQRLALAYDDVRARTILRDLDPVQPGTRERDLGVRRVDERGFARIQHPHPDDDPPLGDEQRQDAVVETRDVHVGVAGKSKLAAAVVDLGAAVTRHPQVVAAGDRVVAQRLDPVLGPLLGREVDAAGDVGQPAGAARQVILGERRDRGGGQAHGEQDAPEGAGKRCKRTRHRRTSRYKAENVRGQAGVDPAVRGNRPRNWLECGVKFKFGQTAAPGAAAAPTRRRR